MILHKLSTSPFTHANLSQITDRIDSQDGILLTQDAIYALSSPVFMEQLFACTSNIYALTPDCIARGISQPPENTQKHYQDQVKMIDYSGFVALTLKFNNIISW